jgi:hypothetical protein
MSCPIRLLSGSGQWTQIRQPWPSSKVAANNAAADKCDAIRQPSRYSVEANTAICEGASQGRPFEIGASLVLMPEKTNNKSMSFAIKFAWNSHLDRLMRQLA